MQMMITVDECELIKSIAVWLAMLLKLKGDMTTDQDILLTTNTTVYYKSQFL